LRIRCYIRAYHGLLSREPAGTSPPSPGRVRYQGTALRRIKVARRIQWPSKGSVYFQRFQSKKKSGSSGADTHVRQANRRPSLTGRIIGSSPQPLRVMGLLNNAGRRALAARISAPRESFGHIFPRHAAGKLGRAIKESAKGRPGSTQTLDAEGNLATGRRLPPCGFVGAPHSDVPQTWPAGKARMERLPPRKPACPANLECRAGILLSQESTPGRNLGPRKPMRPPPRRDGARGRVCEEELGCSRVGQAIQEAS